MSIEMPDRGPDSAGVAVYLNPANRNGVKLRLFSADDGYSWRTLAKNVGKELGDKISIEARASRAVLVVHEDFPVIQAWLGVHHPDLKVMSAGNTIEIFGERGLPKDVVGRLKLRNLKGSHDLGHTCMATESAITTGLSHPFSAGLDLCWCTTARLPNHNRLRQVLARQGVEFLTDKDSEMAADYLTLSLREGASPDEALDAAIRDLDGFYTFAVGTRDRFAVLRDPIACKHAVLAETDDWIVKATEYRPIAVLPGAEKAKICEPAPAQIYSWSRA